MSGAKKALIKVKFIFQYAVNYFGNSIIIAMIFLCHANPYLVLFRLAYMLITAILHAQPPVRKIQAICTPERIRIDGVLDESVWEDASLDNLIL